MSRDTPKLFFTRAPRHTIMRVEGSSELQVYNGSSGFIVDRDDAEGLYYLLLDVADGELSHLPFHDPEET